MSTLTKIYTKPIFKVEMGLTFELDQEKVVTLEEGLLYKVQYVVPNNSGDSTNVLKELIGRISKIRLEPFKMGFNPFYSGDLYNIIFDCSADFHSTQIEITTAQIRDIDIYTISTEGEDNNGGSDNGNSENDGEISGDAGITGDNNETGDGESEDINTDVSDGNSDVSTETGDGDSEPDGENDLNQPTENPEEGSEEDTPVE